MVLLAGNNSRYVLVLVVGMLWVWVPGTPVAAQSSTPDAGVPETNGTVYSVIQSGNRVYVGGNFTTIGGVSRNRLAAFDATTGVVDANWNPNVNNQVLALAVSGGKVYAGGRFTAVNGGTPRNFLAAFNVSDGSNTGTVDANWNPNMGDNVWALAVAGGKVYAGGDFIGVNSPITQRNRLAAFNEADGSNTGTVDANWNPNMSGAVYAVAVSGGKVYAGGLFTTVNGATTRNRLAAFNLADGTDTGTADANWNPNLNQYVMSLVVSGTKVYAGGVFDTVNGATTRYSLAAFNAADGSDTGTTDANWNPNMGNVVQSLAVSGTKVFAGGWFSTVNGGTTRNCLAAFNVADGSDTGTALAWDPNVNTAAYALAPSASGVFAGGSFTTIGGNPKNNLAGFGSTVPVELSVFAAE